MMLKIFPLIETLAATVIATPLGDVLWTVVLEFVGNPESPSAEGFATLWA
jgi:hypothetical protein